MFQRKRVPEEDIYEVLSNSRRRGALRELTNNGNAITLRELSVRLATEESGQSPPPRALRESVYSALHQTHLPLLEDAGIVTYDRESRAVNAHPCARDVDRYMGKTLYKDVTWDELYRTLGIVSLTVLLAALLDVPVIATVDPLLWSSGFLTAFAVAVGYQFWANRWYVLRALRGSSGRS